MTRPTGNCAYRPGSPAFTLGRYARYDGASAHEAYLKLFDRPSLDLRDRSHFFALSTRAMRQVLVDYFRGKVSKRRGGKSVISPLEEELIPTADHGALILAVREAFERLSRLDACPGQVVEQFFFGGMT